jgi:8-oxo-dGTP diphosphatase
MPHLHTAPGEKDFTASGFIVRMDGPEPRVMLHRHRIIHKWIQFGGHVEHTENPWQAIAHEVHEESGYRLEQLKILQPKVALRNSSDAIVHPQPVSVSTHAVPHEVDHWHIDLSYAFTTDQPPADEVEAHEKTEIGLFTTNELQAIEVGKIPENVRDIGLFIMDQLLTEWEALPTDTFQLS